MELPIVERDTAVVRATIASCWLSQSTAPSPCPASSVPAKFLGRIHLRPHQLSAVERIRRAIDELGGALLCDEVGLGKTYVGLAVAQSYGEATVVAPAILRAMWRDSAKHAGVPIHFVSFESLSRGRSCTNEDGLLIVDEAHHARNPRTRRYHQLAKIAGRRPVLLLSATPIHNRSRDLSALLALFLGSRAESLDSATMSRCIVRRTADSMTAEPFPVVDATAWLGEGIDDRLPANLLALPPPLPVRDGGDACALVVRSLVRQWASSDDALVAALRRRIRRASALAAALEEGTYPSAAELESWVRGDEDVQLGFSQLLAPAVSEKVALLDAILAHEVALRHLLEDVRSHQDRTNARANALRAIRTRHEDERIVAFSQYADTILGLYKELRRDPRVCALTATRAMIASGRITRPHALRLFAPLGSGASQPRAIERIDLLLTTDLLSEGVNLQDASVVVHLDLPWTSARLEQRVGRVARMGSAHSCVASYAFAPPSAAERLLGLAATIDRKAQVSADNVGGLAKVHVDRERPVESRRLSVPEATEMIRGELAKWRSERPPEVAPGDVTITANVETDVDGFIAVQTRETGVELVVAENSVVTDDPRVAIHVLRHARGPTSHLPTDSTSRALRALADRARRQRALSPADVSFTAKARRAGLRRLAGVESRSGGHRRLLRLSSLNRARELLAGQLDAATESALEDLSARQLDDDAWLDAISLIPVRPRSTALPTVGFRRRVIALLVLTRK